MMYRGLASLLSVTVLGLAQASTQSDGVEPRAARGFTVEDSVETRSVLESMRARNTPILYSPDGRRFAVLMVRGDLQRNGNWLEILAGSATGLQSAAGASIVAKLFTSSARDNEIGVLSPTHPSANRAVWLDDNERIAFLWNDGHSPTQVTTVNVRTGVVGQLTHHPTSVLRYSVSGDGLDLAYVAFPKVDAAQSAVLRERGFTVSTTNALGLLYGEHESWLHPELFVQSASQPAPRKVDIGRFGLRWPWPSKISPDGRYALCDLSLTETSADWEKYTDVQLKGDLTFYKAEKNEPSQVRQLFRIDLESSSVQPLLDAPSHQPNVLWSPDGRSVIVWPVFLPVNHASPAGLAGTAIAEVDLDTGKFNEIALSATSTDKFVPLEWTHDGLAVEREGKRFWYAKENGEWHLRTDEPGRKLSQAPTVRLELREGMNLPPALYALDSTRHQERMIFDLNPQLRGAVSLGRVEITEWRDRSGKKWTGRLYRPVNYSVSRRYPLVIQTHGYAPATEFSTSGLSYNGGVFAAQALANRGLMVLQVQDPHEGGTSPAEPEIAMSGFESAVESLHKQGLIDSSKVGLTGWSRTGWYVEYALAHSRLPFAAALVADNIDGSYMQALLHNGQLRSEFEADNGAVSYGDGLKTWLERAPGFNTHRMHTPLRMENDWGMTYALSAWEVFSNLQRQGKPVELFMIPDGERAEHPLQNPRQRLASQGGAVDWFDFWLNGHEDPDSAKDEQYSRWRKLRALQQADLGGARVESP